MKVVCKYNCRQFGGDEYTMLNLTIGKTYEARFILGTKSNSNEFALDCVAVFIDDGSEQFYFSKLFYSLFYTIEEMRNNKLNILGI